MRSSNTFSEFELSKFPVGSSARRREGEFARARAMATRCCSPPDNLFANRFVLFPKPSRSRSSPARSRAWHSPTHSSKWKGYVFTGSQFLDEEMKLKDKSYRFVAQSRPFFVRSLCHRPAFEINLSGLRTVKQAEKVEESAFPAAGLTNHCGHFASPGFEGYASQSLNYGIPFLEGMLEFFSPDQSL